MAFDPTDLRRNARRLLKQRGWAHLMTRRNALYLAALATAVLQFVFLFMYLTDDGASASPKASKEGSDCLLIVHHRCTPTPLPHSPPWPMPS
jgi:hypothetical protein